MPRKNTNSRALRQLAEELLHRIADDFELPDDERDDLVISLVRQWITYDGCATLFVGDQQVYLVLGRTPLGKPVVVPEPALSGWMKQLTQDWRVGPDNLPDVIDQLNRGQSAEVVNADDVPLRLWVNPKERSRGVEALVKEDIPPGTKRDYRKIAATELEQRLGEALDPDEMANLACSVAKQWQQYDGHACLFIDAHEQLAFKFTEHGDGTCDVVTGSLSVDLEPSLASCGLSPEFIPEAIVRINLGQVIEFQDSKGVLSRLWHDPKARRIFVERLDLGRQPKASVPPLLCPKCTAVLRPWREGQRQQTCPHCGHTISLG